MADNIKQKTFNGLVWTTTESVVGGVFNFVVGIVLARLLSPSDFGLLAMVGVFTAVANLFVDSGFTNALIRKNDRKEIDYSTVYVTNITLSFVFAVILWFCASPIADFYKEPLLVKIVRFNAAMLVMGSFTAVQGARLTIYLDFRKRSIIRMISSVTTGILCLFLAYQGFGVWALLYPVIFNNIIKGFLFWYFQHWFPGFRFSMKIWKEYFKYGSNLLLSGLIDVLYRNIYPLVIGKKFSATDLGYYGNASKYANLPANTATSILQSVTFPVLAKVQDDKNALEAVYRRLISLSAFVVFPLLVGLCAVSRPFTICVLTEKWTPSIPYLQVLCFALMWYPIHALNLNLLQVKGRSDLFLRLEIVKKILGVTILIITIPYGLFHMCLGQAINSLIGLFINTYYTGKLINVDFIKQMKDVAPSLAYSLSMGLVVWLTIHLIENSWIQLISGVTVGAVYYLGVSKIMKSPELEYVIRLVKENIIHRGK